MSKINLSTVLWYEARSDGRPIGPTVSLEGVESRFPSVRFPEKGITFLYGHRNPGEAYLLNQAAAHGLHASIAQIPVEIDNWIKNKVGNDPDDPERGVQHTGFLSMVRTKKEITEEILRYWGKELHARVEDFPRAGTAHPYLFDRVIEADLFKHLVMIAYPVKTQEAGEFQVATVFNLSKIEGITLGKLFDDVEIVSNRSL